MHQNIGYVVIIKTYDVLGTWGARWLALLIALVLASMVHELVEVRLGR